MNPLDRSVTADGGRSGTVVVSKLGVPLLWAFPREAVEAHVGPIPIPPPRRPLR